MSGGETGQQDAPERTLPPESPLEMPRHGVHEPGVPLRIGHGVHAGTLLARVWIVTVTCALAVYGVTEMYGVLRANTVTVLQWVFLVLFSVNFVWISFAFAQALLGFLVSLSPWRRSISEHSGAVPFKTAILLPVHKEEPARIAAAMP